jgi:hypothetical protein
MGYYYISGSVSIWFILPPFQNRLLRLGKLQIIMLTFVISTKKLLTIVSSTIDPRLQSKCKVG